MQDYELSELVAGLLELKQHTVAAHPELLAVEAAHGTAFHRGLGTNIVEIPFEKYVSVDSLAEFAESAYSKPNVALVANGPSSDDLSKWVGDFFKDLPNQSGSGAFKVQSEASKYYGGEARIASKSGNSIVIAFPGSSEFGSAGYKPEISVLAALLGGESTIKWTPGFSLLSKATEGFAGTKAVASSLSYSDAGLLTITVSGSKVGDASKSVVDAIKKVAAGEVPSEDVKKAAAYAKLNALESVQNISSGLEVTGAALLNGTKPSDAGEIIQAIDGVSAEQVKEVSQFIIIRP